jgi:hypothetical protein
MKWYFKIVFTIIISSAYHVSRAQTSAIPILYEFVIECPLRKCDIIGNTLDSTIYVAPPKSKFTLIELKQDICIIRFTLLNASKKINQSNLPVEDFSTYTYFYITKAQLDFKARPITRSNLDLVVGNVITPVKLRFAPFDFTKDITLGSTFGVKYSFAKKQNAAVDGLLGIGVSSLTIDSTSSQGKTQQPVDLLAFSTSLGIVVEFGNAQVGAFLGFDFISNKNQNEYNWIYRNKPWISFGLGYSIFSFNIKK